MAAKVRRKLGNGVRRLREADRCLKPGVEVLLPHGRPGPPAYPPGGRQGAHAPSRDSSVSQAMALRDPAVMDLLVRGGGQRAGSGRAWTTC